MTPDIKIINPLHFPDWDTILLSTEESTFFHSQAWCDVLTHSYGYEPKYFLVADKGKLSTLIPFMEIKTFFSPKRGISLPFSDYCQPIVSKSAPFSEILDAIFKYAKSASWKFVEFRGGSSYFNYAVPSSFYYQHNLDLKKDEEEFLASFRSSTRRNIKKALKKNVNIRISNSLDAVKKFYRLNCLTRRNHGLPPQPFSFFKKVHDYIIARKKGFVVLAFYQHKIIASAIFFHFGNEAIYKYGASERKYQHLRANNLIMWEAIKWYARNGYRSFSFGRTEPENHGLLQFKRGWRTHETTVYYHKYDLLKNKFIEDPIRNGKFNEIAKKLPMMFLRMAGSLMYKHVG